MDASSLTKSVEEWIAELNNPQAEQRRDALNTLAGSATLLDNRLVDELKLMARGDPDSKTQFLARKVLKSRGINILPQISYPSNVQQTRPFLTLDFWIGFFLFPILNFILFLVPQFYALIANRNIVTFQLVVNVILLIYFWFTRKNVALGILAAFALVVISSICWVFYLVFSLPGSCWPDGCAVQP